MLNIRIVLLLLASLLLQSCAAFIVGGGAGAALSVHDRRTIGGQIDDKSLTRKINDEFEQAQLVDDLVNVNVQVYNRVVLLVGQVPNNQVKRQLQVAAEKVKHIRKLHNQIRVEQPLAASSKTHDFWLASKVKSQLLADKRVDVLNIKVVVEDSEVFLMGIVSPEEADVVVDIVRNVSGVIKVVKAFELT